MGVSEYDDDVKNYFVFHRFNVLVWTCKNDSNALRVDAYYFEICGKFVLKVKECMRI